MFVEPKELLVFFPKDYSAVKVSKKKILGTAQQLTGLKETTWVNVDIGDQDPWQDLSSKRMSVHTVTYCFFRDVSWLTFI